MLLFGCEICLLNQENVGEAYGVARKQPKPLHVRIANGIRNQSVRSIYSKKSPAENMRDMRLDVDLNKEVRRRNPSSKPKEFAAFVGTCDVKGLCSFST